MKALKIALYASLISAAFTVVALKLGVNFWWVGSLMGFVVAYLVVDFKAVVSAVKNSWRKFAKFSFVEWVNGKRTRIIYIFEFASFAVSLFIMAILFFRLINYLGGFVEMEGVKTVCFLMAIAYFVASAFSLVFSAEGYSVDAYKNGKVSLNFGYDELKIFKCVFAAPMDGGIIMFFIITLLNSVAIVGLLLAQGLLWPLHYSRTILSAIYGVLKHLLLLPKYLLNAGVMIIKFLYDVYKQIHTQFRIAFGVDCALGVTMGYFYDSIYIGAIVGAVLGLANYYIVCRIIKVVPRATAFE